MNKSLFGILVIGGVAQSDAAIIFRDNLDISVFSQIQREVVLDIDDNTMGDLTFRVSQRSFDIVGSGTNRVIATPAAPPDLGASITPLAEQIELNVDVQSGLFWYAPALNPAPAGFLACANIGCIGEWREITAFVGVEFDIEGNTHYGWVEIEAPFPGIPGGTVRRLAYEDEAGVSILTGAIPEPSTGLLSVLATSLLLCLRRRS